MKKIVKIWGTGCMPCTKYAPIFEEVSNELSNNTDINFINIDARNDNTGLVELLNVRSIPQTFILDEDNNILKHKTGFMDKNSLIDFINS